MKVLANKTLVIYGILGGFLALQILAVLLISGGSKEYVKYILLANSIFLIFAILLDPFGIFCILLAWFPFSFGILQFEVSVITLSPYTLGMVLLSMFSLFMRVSARRRYGTSKTDIVLAMLCTTYLMSTLMSHNHIQSGFFAFHALFIPVVSYFTIKNMVTNERQYKIAFIYLMVGVITFGAYAITHFRAGEDRLQILGVSPTSTGTIMIWVVISIAVIGWMKTLSGKSIFAASLAIFLAVLSKGFYILLLLSPLFNKIIMKGRAYTLMLSMLIFSLIGTILLAYGSTSFSAGEIDPNEDNSIDRITNVAAWVHSIVGRGHVYHEGLQNFPRNPVFGVGVYRGVGAVVRHNFHVEWLEYGGLSMYILYSSLFLVHFKLMARYARHDVFIRANLLVIFILLVNGLANSITVGTSPYLTFILFGFNEARRRMYISNILTEPAGV